jgi:hypothetical protein
VLFGKKNWSRMSDTAKSLSLLIPISMFFFLYFWGFLLQYPLHGAKLISVPFELIGFFCSVVLLREFLSGKRMSTRIESLLTLFAFFSVVFSSLWISTLFEASKGVDIYRLYLASTHLLETEWTYVFMFGLLTPTIYLIWIFFGDPSFFPFIGSDLSEKDRRSIRTIMATVISIYSITPLLGNLTFAPFGLSSSLFNLTQDKSLRNCLSTMIGVVAIILFSWWLLS